MIGKKINILVVDDDPTQVEILKILLTNDDYVLREAFDGVQAFKIIEDYDIDLVITDIVMPKEDGFGLIKLIKDLDINIPILILTGEIGIPLSRIKKYADSFSIDHVLRKPTTEAILNSAIKTLLDSSPASDF